MKKVTIFLFLLTMLLFSSSSAFAQMMMNNSNSSVTLDPTQIQLQQQEEAQGKQFFDELQNKQTTCAKLTDSDFEKIGEYTMSQMFRNNTVSHIAMNQRIQQMRGQTGEEQMHVQIGKSVTGCAIQNTHTRGGAYPMMGGYGNSNMMNGSFGWGFGLVHLIFGLIILIDLILLGMWLWKQIKKK